MSDRSALYRSIIAQPDDDTPRLVYADWLEENDRAEEAEFIRVECGLESGTLDDPARTDLLDRQTELRMWLAAHEKGPELKFPAGLRLDSGKSWWNQTRRGFPRYFEYDGYGRTALKPVRAMTAALEVALTKIPTRWLVVRFITVQQLAELLKKPILATLDRLTIQLGISVEPQDDACRLIAESPHLRNLRGLSLGFPIGNEGAEFLRSNHLGNVRWLSVDPSRLTPTAVRVLAANPWFRELNELWLNGSCPGPALEMLCEQKPFERLRTLELTDNDFAASVWQTFARSESFPALLDLDLSRTNMSGSRFEALAAAPRFRPRGLNLLACAIGNDGAATLASAPWAASLTLLNLRYNGFSSIGTTEVARCKNLSRLRHLDLNSNSTSGRTLRAINKNPALSGLTSLRLSRDIQTAGSPKSTDVERFLREMKMPRLRHLDLSGQAVTPGAASHLEDDKFSTLTRLELAECNLTDTAVVALLKASSLQNLMELNLMSNGLKSGVAPLLDRNLMPLLSQCRLPNNPIRADLARKLRLRPGIVI